MHVKRALEVAYWCCKASVKNVMLDQINTPQINWTCRLDIRIGAEKLKYFKALSL